MHLMVGHGANFTRLMQLITQNIYYQVLEPLHRHWYLHNLWVYQGGHYFSLCRLGSPSSTPLFCVSYSDFNAKKVRGLLGIFSREIN